LSRIIVTEPIHADGLALLRADPAHEVVAFDPPAGAAQMRAALPGAAAILVRTLPLGADLLALAPDLAIVSKHGVGCDNIDLDHCSARGIPVTICAGANANAVAEHTLALMLACARRLTAQDAAARAGDWRFRQRTGAFELRGRTVLVVGMGRIGRRVAPLCRAFGMRVLGHDPGAAFAEAERADDLDAALAQADIVTLHTPLIPETTGLIDARRLALMKPGAVLINCARGGVADEAALVQALTLGPLAMLGTDVFVTEPVCPTDPLLSLPNVIATPHTGAMTAESTRAMAMQSARNILDCLGGRLDEDVIFNTRAPGRRTGGDTP